MSRFERYLGALSARVEALAKDQFEDCVDSAVRDGKVFIEGAKSDLERWSKLLAGGALTREDFEWLVRGKKDLAVLEALKQRGVAMARLDSFRMSLVDAVVGTAFDVLL